MFPKRNLQDPSNRKRLILIFIMMGILGAWLNAQGGWVKDFCYNRTITLPFLFSEYYTTSFNWYIVGLFDDLVGLTGNLLGIYGLKRLIGPKEIDIYSRKYFILPLIAYLVTDGVAFLNFYRYYSGVINIELYGELWNVLQYFLLLPSLILTDLLLLTYQTGRGGDEGVESGS